jgi:FtsP/CotA-like multicopper oxidase with cupredoxin domain
VATRLPFPLEPFVDPLPVPSVLRPQEDGRLRVAMRAARHRFHRDLPPSLVWTYAGSLPGPTIEVRRGSPVQVEWVNELDGPFPVLSTEAPRAAGSDGVPVQCRPGLSGGVPKPSVAGLRPWTVVHLHGGLTEATSDGWTENMMAAGQGTTSAYGLEQRATLLWYHDHAMGVTQYNVYAGLAGLWLIRDERERELGLAQGAPHELPLLLQDRNFNTDGGGSLTGELVHKTDVETMECFGPFTTVNGTVWPLLEVAAGTYRLRVLNGSNARTFRLVWLVDDRPANIVDQIGSDHGLLLAPVDPPADGLVLAPAERADLLVDFSGFRPGTEVTLVNTAGAPFDGSPFPAEDAADAADPGVLLPFPEVMRFVVVPGDPPRFAPPRQLASDFRRLDPSMLQPDHVVRTIALVEQDLDDAPNVLTMRELERLEQPAEGEPVITITDAGGTSAWRAVASHFEDRVTFFPELDRDEVWRIINLSQDTHPIHIHMNPFQVLARYAVTVDVPDGGITDETERAEVRFQRAEDDDLRHQVDPNEEGLKDTVRVNPREVVDLAVRFTTYSGRYMYHCHILEHEDRDMMRPIVITPREVMPFMQMN